MAKYTVVIPINATIEVEVEAADESTALELAYDMYHNGEIEHHDGDVDSFNTWWVE